MHLSLTGQWTISVKSFEPGQNRQIIVFDSGIPGIDGTHHVTDEMALQVNPPAGTTCLVKIQDDSIDKKMRDSKIGLRFPGLTDGRVFEIGTLDAAAHNQVDFNDLVLRGHGAGHGYMSYTDHYAS